MKFLDQRLDCGIYSALSTICLTLSLSFNLWPSFLFADTFVHLALCCLFSETVPPDILNNTAICLTCDCNSGVNSLGPFELCLALRCQPPVAPCESFLSSTPWCYQWNDVDKLILLRWPITKPGYLTDKQNEKWFVQFEFSWFPKHLFSHYVSYPF